MTFVSWTKLVILSIIAQNLGFILVIRTLLITEKKFYILNVLFKIEFVISFLYIC